MRHVLGVGVHEENTKFVPPPIVVRFFIVDELLGVFEKFTKLIYTSFGVIFIDSSLPGKSMHSSSSMVDSLRSRMFEYFSSLFAPPIPYQGRFPLIN